MVSDSSMFHGKMSDLVWFPLFGLILVVKMRSFDFENHWDTLKFFSSKQTKKDVRFEDDLSNSVWFDLSFISWEDF